MDLHAWIRSKISVNGDDERIISSIQAALRHKSPHGAADRLKRDRVLQRLRADAERDSTMRATLIAELSEDNNFCRQERSEAICQGWAQTSEGVPAVPPEVWEWMHHKSSYWLDSAAIITIFRILEAEDISCEVWQCSKDNDRTGIRLRNEALVSYFSCEE